MFSGILVITPNSLVFKLFLYGFSRYAVPVDVHLSFY